MQHKVHARHVLAAHGPEEVSRALAQAAVGVVLLDHMADIADPVRPAPVPDGLGIILLVQAADGVHQRVAEAGGVLPHVVPKPRQQPPDVLTHLPGENFRHVQPPGHGQHGVFPQHGAAAPARPQGRLVGEEPPEGLAELVLQMSIVGLVHRVDHEPTALGQQRVGEHLGRVALGDVIRRHDEHPPVALGHVPAEHAARYVVGQVNEVIHSPAAHIHMALDQPPAMHAPSGHHGHGEALVPVGPGENIAAPAGAGHVHVLLGEHHAGEGGTLGGAIGKAGGKVGIVQEVVGQAQAAALVGDDVDLPPPGGAKEVGVSTAFGAQGAAAALRDGADAPAQGVLVLPVEPQEGQQSAGVGHGNASLRVVFG